MSLLSGTKRSPKVTSAIGRATTHHRRLVELETAEGLGALGPIVFVLGYAETGELPGEVAVHVGPALLGSQDVVRAIGIAQQWVDVRVADAGISTLDAAVRDARAVGQIDQAVVGRGRRGLARGDQRGLAPRRALGCWAMSSLGSS